MKIAKSFILALFLSHPTWANKPPVITWTWTIEESFNKIQIDNDALSYFSDSERITIQNKICAKKEILNFSENLNKKVDFYYKNQ